MQDYPKALPPLAKVGFSMAPAWICYSPCKNNAKDAAASAAQGVPASAAWTAESDQYMCKAEMLRQIGAAVPRGSDRSFLGITANAGPRVVIDPSTAIFFSELKSVFPSPSNVSLTDRSTLVLSGDVVVESLSLDGRLRVAAPRGTKIVIRAGSRASNQIFNAGDRIVEIPSSAAENLDLSQHYTEVDLMRGYTLVVDEEEFVSPESLPTAAGSASTDPTSDKDKVGAQPRVFVYTGSSLIPSEQLRSTGLFCDGCDC